MNPVLVHDGHAGTAALTALPQAPHWDSSLALWADPYRFIGRTAALLGSDVFETRLLLQRTICLSGSQAARLFYDPQRFERAGAAPEPLRATLFGQGTVQALDGERHRLRKALFVAQTGPAQVADLVAHTRREWLAAVPGWGAAGPVSLYRAVQPVLTRAVCAWAGVPLPAQDVARRSAQLTALFDSAASGLGAHLRSRWARWRAEAWLAAWIEAVRSGRARVDEGRPAAAVAWHRDIDGSLLPPRIAAAELLNLLRPTVAVSVYMVFVAHALQVHPDERKRLLDAGAGSPAALDFVREVRRHYPFFPAVVARVRQDFDWRGLHFARGRRALLDLYGTNHDPRDWSEPMRFMPERFRGRSLGFFEFVPQGGGDVVTQHRCPGEDIATQLMLLALQMLLQEMRFEIPAQDLRIAFDRLPAIPGQGFVIDRVRGSSSF